MASQPAKSTQKFNPYLSPNQQDLLLAALNSQATGNPRAKPATGDTGITNQPTSDLSHSATTVFQSPGNMDNYNPDLTPDLDYFDGDASFDFDNADLGGEMIGGLPGLDADGKPEQHEKRKNTDDDGSPVEGSAKRQELAEGEKGSKKPGRKPLTNEPTTKRKAQNRAAQRAFRDRKEKHLKDLETRVLELAKAREADQHENGLLKAQVDRLQVELKDYRKRLSLNASAGRGSPPSATYNNPSKSGSASTNGQNNFQFDFPKFGALPGSQIFPNAPQNGGVPQNGSVNSSQRGSATPPVTNQSPGSNVAYTASAQQPVLNRANSSGVGTSPGSLQSGGSNTDSPANSSNYSANNIASTYNFAPYSTNDNMHGFATTLPQMNGGGNDPFGDLFSPSILKTVGQSGNGYFNPNQQITNTGVNNGGDSTAGIPDNRVFRFNSTSNTSDSASPSASSLSQWNLNGTTNSSCGTSPEPSHGSPLNKDKPNESYDKTNLQNSYTATTSASTNNALTSNSYSNDNFAAFDMSNTNPAFNMPQLDSFDPVMFGDYRDTSQDNMFGGADYSGDFFNDALNSTIPLDYSSPANMFGILPPASQPVQQQPSATPAPSRNLMAEMDKTRDGGDDDYGLPAQYQQQPAQQQQRQQSTATKKDGSGNLISCNNIWNQLQSNPDFQDGKFDLDGLCSELRAKARCSESGVMVDQDHVDKALKKLGKTAAENAREGHGPPEKEDQAHLMFEQESWDNVLKKLGGGAART
ncbi:hypothetical protein Q7P36_001008 [Cladosporium allicinum]